MGKWFNVIKDKEYLKEFIEMFCAFHDYRITKIIFDAAQNQVDVILEYDTPNVAKVLLRFIGISAMHINTDIDYEVDWLSGTEFLLTDSYNLLWYNEEGYSVEQIRKAEYLTWIESERVHFAVLDKNEMPAELPDSYLHQTWHVLNDQTMKYEDIHKEFRVFECKERWTKEP